MVGESIASSPAEWIRAVERRRFVGLDFFFGASFFCPLWSACLLYELALFMDSSFGVLFSLAEQVYRLYTIRYSLYFVFRPSPRGLRGEWPFVTVSTSSFVHLLEP
jgi:hypothetical protein